MILLILNGPNLNLLGKRETEIYGHQTFDHFMTQLKKNFLSHTIQYYQSNHEGDLIDKLHAVGFEYDGIVFNPGAYTHTSIALRDAISSITTPVVEVHISDIFKRESFRHTSYIKDVCICTITGKGLQGYDLALTHLINSLNS